MEIIPQLVLLIIVFCVTVLLGYTTLKGAPYAPLGYEKINNMLDLLDVKTGEKAADLGSGDGRIVIELARTGAKAYGYEINPFLVLITKYKIKKFGLEKNAFILMKNYWMENLSEYKIITVFGAPHIMKSLGEKLKKELKPGTRIASNYFKFPDWKHIKEKNKIYIYKI